MLYYQRIRVQRSARRLIPAHGMQHKLSFMLDKDLVEANMMKLRLSRPWGRFLVLILAAAMMQLLFRLCLRAEGDAGAALLVIYMNLLLPLASFLLPLWAGLGGVPPIAACLPISGMAMICSSAPVWLCGACTVLSIVAAAAGQEWTKRKGSTGGGHHGGTSQKR